jgi:pseudouridine kinase
MSRNSGVDNNSPKVTCIGSANIDSMFFAYDEVGLFKANTTSNHLTFGGVARNVTENLLKLGISTSLVTCFGDDAEGRLLKSDLIQKGIDTAFCYEIKSMKTCVFSALIDTKGEIFVASISNADIFETLNTELFERIWEAISNTHIVFMDAFLSSKSLEYIIKRCKAENIFLMINPVSPLYSMKLPQDLSGISLLVASECEVEALAQISKSDSDFCNKAAHIIHRRGVRDVIITCGNRGAFCSSEGNMKHLPSYPVNAVDTIGGGDAFIAGVVYSMQKGDDLIRMCKYGLAAASITVQSIDTVSSTINLQLLEATAR